MKKEKKTKPPSIIEAARRFAGDSEQDSTPISAEEEKAMAEVRREYRRPNQKEIQKEAERIFKK